MGDFLPFTDDEFRSIASNLAGRESGGNPRIVNQLGYRGLYQFGAQAAEDIGLLKPGAYKSYGNAAFNRADQWAAGMNLETFQSDPELQTQALKSLWSKNYQGLKQQGVVSDETPADEVAGLLYGAHLGGVGGVSRYVRSGGKDDASDANNTKISSYVQRGMEAFYGVDPSQSGATLGDPSQLSWGQAIPDTQFKDSTKLGRIGAIIARESRTRALYDYVRQLVQPEDVMDPNFNPVQLAAKQGYEQHLEQFVGVPNQAAYDRLRMGLDKQIERTQIAQSASLTESLLGNIAGELTSIDNYLLGGLTLAGRSGLGLFKSGAKALGIMDSVLSKPLGVAGTVAGITAGQEAILHSMDPTRTQEESIHTVIGSAVLGGVLSSLAKKWSAKTSMTPEQKDTLIAEGTADIKHSTTAEKKLFKQAEKDMHTPGSLSQKLDDLPDAEDLSPFSKEGATGFLSRVLNSKVMAFTPLSRLINSESKVAKYWGYITSANSLLSKAEEAGKWSRGTNLSNLISQRMGQGQAILSEIRTEFTEALAKPDAIAKSTDDFYTEVGREVLTPGISKDPTVLAAASKAATWYQGWSKVLAKQDPELEKITNIPLAYDLQKIAGNKTAAIQTHTNAFLKEAARNGQELSKADASRYAKEYIADLFSADINLSLKTFGIRGSKENTFQIRPEDVIDFLDHDIRRMVNSYNPRASRTSSVIEVTGDINASAIRKGIQADFMELRMKDGADLRKLGMEEAKTLRDFDATLNILKGTYDQDPFSLSSRLTRGATSAAYLAVGANMSISQMVEFGKFLGYYTMGRVFKTEMGDLGYVFKKLGLSPEDLRVLQSGTEGVLDGIVREMAETGELSFYQTAFEKYLLKAVGVGSNINLMRPLTDWQTRIAAHYATENLIVGAKKLLDGSASRAMRAELNMVGIGDTEAKAILRQLAKYGETKDGILHANISKWDAEADRGVQAIINEAMQRLVRPQAGDTPLWMRSKIGRLFGQFNKFVFATHQKTLLPGVQRMDGKFAMDMGGLLSMGALHYMVKESIRVGPDKIDMSPDRILMEAMDRSGAVQLLMWSNAWSRQLVGIDLGTLTGTKPLLRRIGVAGPSQLGAAPSLGLNLLSSMGTLARGDGRQRDFRNILKATIPFNTFPLMDAMAGRLVGATGLPGGHRPSYIEQLMQRGN